MFTGLVEALGTVTAVVPEPPGVRLVVAAGPLAAVLRIARRLHDSDLVQEVWLRRGSRRLDFRTTIEWREHRKLLKVCFPVRVHADHALHEIQFGHLARPNHASRPFDADRFEVAQQKWTALAETGRGAAVLNDGKYGVNVVGQSINLTLLRAPVAPDKKADLGRQEFTYAFYAWNGGLHESGLVREGYALNVPAWAAAGDGGGRRSVLSVDRENIVVETLKPAEDGSGDLVVRLYESARLATRCALHVHLPVRAASFANLVEESPRRAPFSRGCIALEFRPFEIKTLRLRLA